MTRFKSDDEPCPRGHVQHFNRGRRGDRECQACRRDDYHAAHPDSLSVKTPIMDRFHSRYRVDAGGCWRWTGNHMSTGYAGLHGPTKYMTAHRFSYIVFKGPIPNGLVIDHLCRVRDCVNPEHLEAVTYGVNNLRAWDVRRANIAARA